MSNLGILELTRLRADLYYLTDAVKRKVDHINSTLTELSKEHENGFLADVDSAVIIDIIANTKAMIDQIEALCSNEKDSEKTKIVQLIEEETVRYIINSCED